jgi:hypothetical protein
MHTKERALSPSTVTVSTNHVLPMFIPVVISVSESSRPVPIEGCDPIYRYTTDVAVAELPEALSHVVASPRDVRLLAAWNDDHVFVSFDEGRSFRRVLDGSQAVKSAVFDCHGRLLAIRGHRLGVYDERAKTDVWQDTVTAFDPAHILVINEKVFLVGVDHADDTRLLIAANENGRWRSHPLFHDESYSSWDGIELNWVAITRHNHVRMLVTPWQGGSCGYAESFELRGILPHRVRTISLGPDASPDPPADRMLIFGDSRDAAGRPLSLSDENPRRVERTHGANE